MIRLDPVGDFQQLFDCGVDVREWTRFLEFHVINPIASRLGI
jgi:hypothetical protein